MVLIAALACQGPVTKCHLGGGTHDVRIGKGAYTLDLVDCGLLSLFLG